MDQKGGHQVDHKN